MSAHTHNQPPYSVSEIAGGIKHLVEENFGRVRVRGEISQFKVHSASGHAYFTLKDEKSVLASVIWRGSLAKLGFRPEDGLEVIATGKVTTYPGKSQYQLVVETMEVAGEGALMALLEKRKKQLAAEGLFAPERKRPLPYLPEVIGVITSPTGAVIRDILHRIGDRFPRHVIVWPVLVQGEGAAAQIAAAIEGFNSLCGGRPAAPHPPHFVDAPLARLASRSPLPKPDLLIVARGGGSIEDLWPFNEEIVVRAAAASRIPLISAVGHETDTTLIDFASDKRAPTPTAAAEMAVPVRSELLANVTMLSGRAQLAISRRLSHRSEHLEALARALPRPAQILEGMTQRLDDWTERLASAPERLIAAKTAQWEKPAQRHAPSLLLPLLQRSNHALILLTGRLQEAFQRRSERAEHRLALLAGKLEAMDARAVLRRGFALVHGTDGKLITRAGDAQPRMRIEWADGSTQVATAPKTAQGELF